MSVQSAIGVIIMIIGIATMIALPVVGFVKYSEPDKLGTKIGLIVGGIVGGLFITIGGSVLLQ